MATTTRLLAALGEEDSLLKQQYRESLPPTNLEFYLPLNMIEDAATRETVVDTDAMTRLPEKICEIKADDEDLFALRTTGDGNCLTSALSRSMWGCETWSTMLRSALYMELVGNEKKYRELLASAMEADVEDTDWNNDYLMPSRISGAYLGPLHVFALANVLKRPLILYGREDDTKRFGYGVHGVGGTFLPHFVPVEEQVSNIPIAIAWSSDAMIHFVPLAGVETKSRPQWPILPLAFQVNESSDRLMMDLSGDVYGQDIHNPFVDDLKNAYMRCGQQEKLWAHLLEEYDAEKELKMELDKAAKREIKRLSEMNGIEKIRLPDNTEYDLSLTVVITSKIGKQNITVYFDYEDDPNLVEQRVYQQYGLSNTLFNQGQLSRKVNALQLKFEDHEGRYSLTKTPGPSIEQYKYCIEGREVDFVLMMGTMLLVTYNIGENYFDVASAFLKRHCIDLKFAGIVASLMENNIEESISARKLMDEAKALLKNKKEKTRKVQFSHFPNIVPLGTYLELGREPSDWIVIIKKQIVSANVELMSNGSENMLTSDGLNSLDSILSIIEKPLEYHMSTIPENDILWLLSIQRVWPIDTFFDLLRATLNIDSVNDGLAVFLVEPFNLLGHILRLMMSRVDSLRSIRIMLRVLCNLSVRGKVRGVLMDRVGEVLDVLHLLVSGSEFKERLKSKDFCSLVSTLCFNISSWLWETHTDINTDEKTQLALNLMVVLQKVLYYEKEPESTFSTIRGMAALGTAMWCVPEAVTKRSVDVTQQCMLRLPSVRQQKEESEMFTMARDLLDLFKVLGYNR